jgi:hypothetical protein
MEMVSPSADADLIDAEADMDEKHEDDRHPVVEFGENRR